MAASRATSTEWISLPRICAWGWSKLLMEKSATRSMLCCSIATTTTRKTENTAPWWVTSCAWLGRQLFSCLAVYFLSCGGWIAPRLTEHYTVVQRHCKGPNENGERRTINDERPVCSIIFHY